MSSPLKSTVLPRDQLFNNFLSFFNEFRQKQQQSSSELAQNLASLTETNRILENVFNKCNLTRFEKQNESALIEISKCLIELQVSPSLAAEESYLLNEIFNLNQQHHQWLIESSATLNHTETQINNLLQHISDFESDFAEESSKLKTSIISMKKESIQFKNQLSDLEIESVRLEKSMQRNDYNEAYENYSKLPLESINELMNNAAQLAARMNEIQSELNRYDGIPADFYLAKVELAKCDAMLEELASQKEDMLFRLSALRD